MRTASPGVALSALIGGRLLRRGPIPHAGEMDRDQTRRPGDVLLGRYFDRADADTRELARADFKRLIGAVLRIALRAARDESTGSDSPEVVGRLKIPPVA